MLTKKDELHYYSATIEVCSGGTIGAYAIPWSRPIAIDEFHSPKNGTILIKYNYKDWILLVSFSKTPDPRVHFEKRFAHYEIYTCTLCLSYLQVELNP